MQGDAADSKETAKLPSQRKSLRPSLTRSPTVNKGAAAAEKPGAAMVHILSSHPAYHLLPSSY